MSKESEKPQAKQDIEMVRAMAQQLGEHFDTVHIFATRHMPAEEDGTITVNMGVGNWYARYGQISEWLVKQNERGRMKEREPE